MSALFSAKSLKVSIANRNVCDDLNISINSGECWGVLGINGIGKTTLLHTLAGLRDPDEGDIYYQDTNIRSLGKTELAKKRGVLFQTKSDPFPATVLETVLIGRHPHIENWQWESKKDIELATNSLQQVDLAGMEDRYTSSLSGGERQRVAIATILAQQPDIYLLDEPTNHLDVQHQIKLMQLLHNSNDQQDSAFIMILHDLNLAARFCDHILMLFGNGKVLAGETKMLLTAENLNELYGYPIKVINDNSQDVFLPG
ncbi:ABC transporter ATP-binding protein [Kaarinaea lacus]